MHGFCGSTHLYHRRKFIIAGESAMPYVLAPRPRHHGSRASCSTNANIPRRRATGTATDLPATRDLTSPTGAETTVLVGPHHRRAAGQRHRVAVSRTMTPVRRAEGHLNCETTVPLRRRTGARPLLTTKAQWLLRQRAGRMSGTAAATNSPSALVDGWLAWRLSGGQLRRRHLECLAHRAAEPRQRWDDLTYSLFDAVKTCCRAWCVQAASSVHR